MRGSGPSDRPVFVGGTGRSGTTIMGELVGSRADLTMLPIELRLHCDPGGLADLAHGRVRIDEFEEKLLEKWFWRTPNNSGPRGVHVVADRERVDEALAVLRRDLGVDPWRASAAFLDALASPYAEERGGTDWVEMTPTNAFAFADLARMFPYGRFIWMVRDGRDVASSVARRSWGPNDIRSALTWWTDGMIQIQRAVAATDPGKVLTLRLESLVGPDREDAYARLLAFLDRAPDPDMRTFFDSRLSADKARPGSWSKSLSPEERRGVDELYAQELQRLADAGIFVEDTLRAGGDGDANASGLRRRMASLVPPIRRRDHELAELRAEVGRLNNDVRRLSADIESRGVGPQKWVRPRVAECLSIVRASGLFDEAWYRAQVAGDPGVPDIPENGQPVRHYIRQGAPRGLSPHPGFLPSWYAEQFENDPAYTAVQRIGASPFLHYLTVGARRGFSPHPAFDAHVYLEEHPEAATAKGGPLGHFLRRDSTHAASCPLEQFPSGAVTVRRTREEFLLAARRTGEMLLRSRGFSGLQRESRRFDREAETLLKESLRATGPVPGDPLVSVILPTKDRAAQLRETIDSILAQTWAHWELLVVDDGSTDDTADVLAAYADDPRVQVLRHEVNRGVAAARNTGLARARGTYVAYLDSDNTWLPDFLELMVRFLTTNGHQVGYAMSALVEQGGRRRVLYRGIAVDRAAIRERNYADCITLVHERALLERTGGFDETLRRTVDWDLFLRLAREAEFAFLPVIATEYDPWDDRSSRITTDETEGYRYTVLQRASLDWDEVRAGLERRTPGLVSIVVVAAHSATLTAATVQRALATATRPSEVVVVDARTSEHESARIQLALEDVPQVRVHRLPQIVSLEVARNLGAALSTGDTLVFLAEGAWCESGWQEPLLAGLDTHAAVQPLVLDRKGSVWSAGVFQDADGVPVLPYRLFAGDAPEVRGTRTVDASSAACLAVGTADFVAVEGFDPLFVNAWTGGELSLRLAEHTGRPPGCAGASVVALLDDPTREPHVRELAHLRPNQWLLTERWRDRASVLTARLGEDGYRIAGHGRAGSGDTVGHPVLLHDRTTRPLRWALKIGPADVPDRENWGDWHFALALRDSLERLGHQVTVDCVEDWYRPTAYLDDVVVALRGLHRYETSPGPSNLLWVISHPDLVSTQELRSYDAVLGASHRWADDAGRRLGRPVVPLLQCTDHRRFHPVETDPSRAEDILVVANVRGSNPTPRPTVKAALEAGFVPSVYGVRWQGLLPDGAWKGRYVPNEELATYYASAGVVLNDHWADMISWGVVSNRLFDLTACEARVISDHLPELADLFGDVVGTWQEVGDFPALVARFADETPEQVAARQALGERVRREHTFDARAQTLSAHAVRLRGAHH